tara:strand:- start:49 stop:498 length:450 start_codon:yes stop_codon:yes gene_type:complete
MVNQRLKRLDKKLGNEGERYVKNYLRTLYPKSEGYGVKTFSWYYAPFDIAITKNGKIIKEYEVKNRRANFDTYPSLMFSRSKMEYVKKKIKTGECKDFTFLWLLNDNKIATWDYIDDKDQYYYDKGINAKRDDTAKDCVYVWTKYIDCE